MTQILDRMVRMALARRIPSSDMLNSFAYVLPNCGQISAVIAARNMFGERDVDGTDSAPSRRRV